MDIVVDSSEFLLSITLVLAQGKKTSNSEVGFLCLNKMNQYASH
jgi:hypothetical protein